MMDFVRQLRLVLRNNLIARRRQPVLLSLEICWPLLVFGVVVIIRLSTLPDTPHQCHFAPRALPSAGTLPFLQSFVCNVGKTCVNQSGDQADLRSPSLVSLTQLIHNDTVKRVLRHLPDFVELGNYFRDVLKTSEAEELLKENFTLRSFLIDGGGAVGKALIEEINLEPAVAQSLLDVTFNFSQLFRSSSGSLWQVRDTLCDPKKLQQYVILSGNTTAVSASLCSLTEPQWLALGGVLRQALNSVKITRMVSNMLSLFGDSSVATAVMDVWRLVDKARKLGHFNDLSVTLDSLSANSAIFPHLLTIISTVRSPDIDIQLLTNALEDVEHFGSKKFDANGNEWQQWKEVLSFAKDTLHWTKMNFANESEPSELVVGSIFGESRKRVEAEIFNTNLRRVLDEPLTPEDSDSVLRIRSETDLKMFVCGKWNGNGSCPSSEWPELLAYTDMQSFVKMADMKRTRRAYSAVKLKDIVRKSRTVEGDLRQAVPGDTLDSVMAFADAVRFEPLWRSTRQAIEGGSLDGLINAGLTAIWSIFDMSLRSTSVWNDLKEGIRKSNVIMRWASSWLEQAPDKRLNFGHLVSGNETTAIDEAVAYMSKNSPAFLVAIFSAQPTPELTKILETFNSTRNLEEMRFLYCQSPGFINLVRFDGSVDRSVLKQVQDALCRFNGWRLLDELKTAFDYDGFAREYSGQAYTDTVAMADVYAAYKRLISVGGRNLRRWMRIASSQTGDWSTVGRVSREWKTDLQDATRDPMDFMHIMVQHIRRTMDPSSSRTILEFVGALNADITSYRDGTSPLASLVSTTIPLISSVLETASDPVRLERLVIAPDLHYAFCQKFDSYFAGRSAKRAGGQAAFDSFRSQRMAMCQPKWKQRTMENLRSGWNSPLFQLITDMARGQLSSSTRDWRQPLNDQEWWTISEYGSRIVDFLLSTEEEIGKFNNQARSVVTEAQHFRRTMASGSVKYYASMVGMLTRSVEMAMKAVSEGDSQNTATFGIRRWPTRRLLTSADELVSAVHALVSADSSDIMERVIVNSPPLLHALQSTSTNSTDFKLALENAIIHTRKLLDETRNIGNGTSSCEYVRLENFISFQHMPTEGQMEQVKSFVCRHLPIFVNEARRASTVKGASEVDLTRMAVKITEIGSTLEHVLRDSPGTSDPNHALRAMFSLNDFSNYSSSTLDTMQAKFEDIARQNPTVARIWPVLKMVVLYFTGLARAAGTTVAALRQRTDPSTGVVTVIASDLMGSNAEEMTKMVRLVERIPDVAEYLLYDVLRHQDKVSQLLGQSNTIYQDLCRDHASFIRLLPQPVTLPPLRHYATRKPLSSRDIYSILCDRGEIDLQRVTAQQHQQNPELFAAVEMTSQVFSVQPIHDYPVNLSTTYGMLTRVLTEVGEWNDVRWILFNDSRLMDTNYWMEMYKAHILNWDDSALTKRNDIQAMLSAILNPILTRHHFGPALGAVQYGATGLRKRLLELPQRNQTVAQLLRSTPELRNMASLVDSDDNIFRITEILLYSVSEKPERFGELFGGVDQARQRICMNGWPKYVAAPPDAPHESVKTLLTKLCQIKWERLANEAVRMLEPKMSTFEDATATLDQLRQEFGRQQTVNVSAMLVSIRELIETLQQLRNSQPHALYPLKLSWLDQPRWETLGQRLQSYLVNEPRLLLGTGEDLMTLLNDFLRNNAPSNAMAKTMLTTINFLNSRAASFRGPPPADGEYQDDDWQHAGNMAPMLAQLRQFVHDSLLNWPKMKSLAEHLVRSPDPKTEFCHGIRLKNYLRSDVAEQMQRALCKVDSGKLAALFGLEQEDNGSPLLATRLLRSIRTLQRSARYLKPSSLPSSPTSLHLFGGTVQQWRDTAQLAVQTFHNDLATDSRIPTVAAAGLLAALAPLLPEPTARVLDSVVLIASAKLKTLPSGGDVTLRTLFPLSPYLRNSLEMALPLLPQLVETALWSSPTLITSFLASTRSMSEARARLCSGPTASSWWTAVWSPSLSNSNPRALQNAVCWIIQNWPSVGNELDKELASSGLEPNGARLVDDARELVTAWSRVPSRAKLVIGENDEWTQMGTYQRIFQRWKDTGRFSGGAYDGSGSHYGRALGGDPLRTSILDFVQISSGDTADELPKLAEGVVRFIGSAAEWWTAGSGGPHLDTATIISDYLNDQERQINSQHGNAFGLGEHGLVRLADGAQSMGVNPLTTALDDVLTMLENRSTVLETVRPTVQFLKARVAASRKTVMIPLSTVLREPVEGVLQGALLNDPLIVDGFKEARFNISNYLSHGLNMDRGILCRNSSMGNTIVLKNTDMEQKISRILCRLDYRRLVRALETAIDVDKALAMMTVNQTDTNNTETLGQLLKQTILDASSGKCQLRINGSGLLAEIAELSTSQDWPAVKERVVDALEAADGLLTGTDLHQRLIGYRRDVDSVSGLLEATGKRGTRRTEGSLVPTVRALLRDPTSFTKFLEENLNIPYKFTQILLAAHVRPSKTNSALTWCSRGRLEPVFVAVDAATLVNIEQILCMKYYPAILNALDQLLSGKILQFMDNDDTAFKMTPADWSQFVDQLVYISRNLPASSPDNAMFDAVTDSDSETNATGLHFNNAAQFVAQFLRLLESNAVDFCNRTSATFVDETEEETVQTFQEMQNIVCSNSPVQFNRTQTSIVEFNRIIEKLESFAKSSAYNRSLRIFPLFTNGSNNDVDGGAMFDSPANLYLALFNQMYPVSRGNAVLGAAGVVADALNDALAPFAAVGMDLGTVMTKENLVNEFLVRLEKSLAHSINRLHLDRQTNQLLDDLNWTDGEGSLNVTLRNLLHTVARMTKHETRSWPILFVHLLRNSRQWEPSMRLKILRRFTRLRKLLRPMSKLNGSMYSNGSDVDEQDFGVELADAVRIFAGDDKRSGHQPESEHELVARKIAEQISSQVWASCTAGSAEWSVYIRPVLRHLPVVNSHIRAFPEYADVACPSNADGPNMRQLYDYFVYHSTIAEHADHQTPSESGCREYADQLRRLIANMITAAEYLRSEKGKSTYYCLGKIFHSADRYLELVSAAGHLFREPATSNADLLHRWRRSLVQDDNNQQRFLLDTFDRLIGLGPNSINGALNLARDAVEFTQHLLKSCGADWTKVTLGKVLTAVEHVKDWDKKQDSVGLGTLVQHGLERRDDPVGNSDNRDLLKGIQAIRAIHNAVRRVMKDNYVVADLIHDKDGLKSLLTSELHLPRGFVETVVSSKVQLAPVFSYLASNSTFIPCARFLRNVLSDTGVCSAWSPLCSLNSNDFRRFWTWFSDGIGVWPVLRNYLGRQLESNMSHRGLSIEEIKGAFRHIHNLPQIMPALDSVVGEKGASGQDERGEHSNLMDIGRLLCGRTFQFNSVNLPMMPMGQTRQLTQEDKVELSNLPSQYCRQLYLTVINSDIGRLLWKFVKPLIRGKILVAPDSISIRRLMTQANGTFTEFGSWLMAARNVESASKAFTQWNDSLSETLISSSLKHPILRAFIAEWSGEDPSALDIGLRRIRNLNTAAVSTLREMAGQLEKISDCLQLDRFVFFSTEVNLEMAARRMLDSGDMLAGIIFDQNASSSLWPQLPKHVKYTIRMNSDFVSSTDSTRQSAGSQHDSIGSLYSHVFVSLQDMIDQAIIEFQGNHTAPGVAVHVQEMPVAQYQPDRFQPAMKYMLALLSVIASVITVGTSIRSAVMESDQGLIQVMKIMGLKANVRWIAWLVSSSAPSLFASVLTALVLKVGLVLPRSNLGLLMIMTTVFNISLLSLGFLISTIFTGSSAVVAGIIIYIISYLPYVIICPIGSSVDLPYWAKLAACLLSPTAFSCALTEVAAWEERGVGVQVWTMTRQGYSRAEISFAGAIAMIMVDCVLYWLLACALSAVLKGKLSKIRLTKFWSVKWNRIGPMFEPFQKSCESFAVDSMKAAASPAVVVVSIRGLTKYYRTDAPAVYDLSLDLHQGQVTVLLGRNGAGKTTTINMLTGGLRPSSGTICIYGNWLSDHNQAGKKLIGICPQQNILNQLLTVREHLLYFGALKGTMGRAELNVDVERLLMETDLAHLADTKISALSCGTKRRLCVAIAFCGGSKFIILDEPSAGVDPVARRQLWDIVQRQKHRCTILLTTHYMDEAKYLGDQIAILDRGRLLTCAPVQSWSQQFDNLILRIIKHTRSTHSPPAIGVLLPVVKEYFPHAQIITECGKVVEIALSAKTMQAIGNLERLCRRLDAIKWAAGVQEYTLRTSDLEELHDRITSRLDESQAPVHISHSPVLKSDVSGEAIRKRVLCAQGWHLRYLRMKALLYKRMLRAKRDVRLIVNGLVLPCLLVALAMAMNMLKSAPDLEKPLTFSNEMQRSGHKLFYQEANTQTGYGNQISREFRWTCENGISGGKSDSHPTRIGNGSALIRVVDSPDPEQTQIPEYGCDMILVPKNVSLLDYLVDSQHSQDRFGGWSLHTTHSSGSSRKDNLKIWFSKDHWHSLPALVSTARNVALRASAAFNKSSDPTGYSIATSTRPMQPLKRSLLNEENILNKIADFGVAMVLVLAFSFIPAALTSGAVEERASKQRHLQRLNGIGRRLYWASTFLWDLAFYCSAVAATCLIVVTFGHEAYSTGTNLSGTVSLLLLYGLSNLVLMYHVQGFFKDNSVAFVGLLSINLFIIVNTMLPVALLVIVSSDGDNIILKTARMSFLIFPQYALGGGLVELATSHLRSQMNEEFGGPNVDENPFSLDVIGGHLLALALQFLLLGSIGLFLEGNLGCWFTGFTRRISFSVSAPNVRDDQSEAADCVLRATQLSKVYSAKPALRDVTLSLGKGECLGLLGQNGAGKTTLLEIISGGLSPTSGRLEIMGEVFRTKEDWAKWGRTKVIGYCPQHNAFDHFLTARETLRVHGMMLGYHGDILDKVVDDLMDDLHLAGMTDKQAKYLSGGYGRLLCLALALLDEPPLLVLDEPTSAMDPHSRRMVWARLMRALRTGCSIVVSGQSVEDCQEMCDRYALMVDGTVPCVRTKHSLHFGYNVTVWLKDGPHAMEQLESSLKFIKMPATKKGQDGRVVQLFVPRETKGTETSIYAWLNGLVTGGVAVDNCSVEETSFDEVFVNFMHQQTDHPLTLAG